MTDGLEDGHAVAVRLLRGAALSLRRVGIGGLGPRIFIDAGPNINFLFLLL